MRVGRCGAREGEHRRYLQIMTTNSKVSSTRVMLVHSVNLALLNWIYYELIMNE
jgi:hypothetical protein